MKEFKFQRNAFTVMLVTSIIFSVLFVIDTIFNGLNWLSMIAILYLLISTLERYTKYKIVKIKYFKSAEN